MTEEQNTPTRLPPRRRAGFSNTLFDPYRHTSATTCAIGNAIISKTATFSSPSPLIYCIGRRVGRCVGVWIVACLIALALECFGLIESNLHIVGIGIVFIHLAEFSIYRENSRQQVFFSRVWVISKSSY